MTREAPNTVAKEPELSLVGREEHLRTLSTWKSAVGLEH